MEFAERVRSAAGAGAGLCLRGNGTKDFYGGPLQGERLEVGAHAGIVSYEPSELVVTARCGTRLADLEAELAQHHQMLAFEPPHFGPGATLGGCVAAGLSGPRRAANGAYYGAVRDFVLGCVLMDGRGDVMRFGGQVMKNVAGYDVSRLVTGSMGTLGILLEMSLKVLPQPVANATLRFEMGEAAAVSNLNDWGGRPYPLTASAWCDGVLHVRLEGAAAAVEAACAALGGERIDAAGAVEFWRGLREQTAPFFDGSGALWRLSVPSTSPAGPVPGATGQSLVEWGGAQRWWKGEADAGSIRQHAAVLGGHATLFRGGDRAAGVFSPLEPGLARLHHNVKAVFDPAGVFNRGRLYPQW